MLKLQDTIFFFCRECDQAGYQPFLLSNTSGLQFYLKQNSTSSGESAHTHNVPLCQRALDY